MIKLKSFVLLGVLCIAVIVLVVTCRASGEAVVDLRLYASSDEESVFVENLSAEELTNVEVKIKLKDAVTHELVFSLDKIVSIPASDSWEHSNFLDRSALEEGNYNLVVEVFVNGSLEASDRVILTLNTVESVPVPELSVLLLPLIALSVLAFIFFAARAKDN